MPKQKPNPAGLTDKDIEQAQKIVDDEQRTMNAVVSTIAAELDRNNPPQFDDADKPNA